MVFPEVYHHPQATSTLVFLYFFYRTRLPLSVAMGTVCLSLDPGDASAEVDLCAREFSSDFYILTIFPANFNILYKKRQQEIYKEVII